MEKQDQISIKGQWYGYFSYGPEYGNKLCGEKVLFSILIEDLFNNKFKGKCIELEGIGASTEVATIEGFIENDFISFRKEYPTQFTIDESGKEARSEELLHPRLCYTGIFDGNAGKYSGAWEVWNNERAAGDGIFVDIFTGVWEIAKDSSIYGI